MEQPVIYDYTDYRAFLSDMYDYMKSEKKYFSYRYFAKKAGFSSPNYLKLVIDRQRNLTDASIQKVAKGFDLNKSESSFLENLVNMNQATSHNEKDFYYNKIISLRHRRDGHFLEKEEYEYFSKWYYPVIREILVTNAHSPSSEDIAVQLNPSVTAREVENALDLLSKLNLIKRESDGRWQQTSKAVTTGAEVRSVIVTNFHKEMINLAVESIDRHSPELRDVSALILNVRQETIPRLKKMLAEFRQELIDLVSTESHPEMVVVINMQMFPTSNPKTGGGS